jgi:hypothetical protein
MQALKPGLLYFAVVFGAGFVLGPIRIIWAVPRFGTRWAELLEMPLMLTVTVLAARWIIRKFAVPPASSVRLGMGFWALVLMLVAEFLLVTRLRGISISEYLATRDPLSGAAYYVTLIVFALMPLLVVRK